MDEENLHNLRHSLAHVLAAAISRIYGYKNVKFGVGPVVENGFYYDFDFSAAKDSAGKSVKISDDDLAKVEKEMRKIIAGKQDFIREDKTISGAEKWARENHQPYKLELIEDLKNSGTTSAKDLQNLAENIRENPIEHPATPGASKISFYQNGDFVDLCRGGHVANTGEIPPDAFKLTRIAGAYWRGDEKNPMMTRIYGVAFAAKQELEEYLKEQEEAKLRDHRKLGRELDLFVFSDLVGAGLPLFTPRGTILRDELRRFTEELRENYNYEKVWTPHITKIDLYKTSGHWEKFGDELFLVKSQETKDEFALKPMTCPHHTQIYASRPRTYRELPIKYLHTTEVYRDEKTGELGGLARVRSITQDDSHVFAAPDQVEQVFGELIEMAREMYAKFAMDLSLRLSFRGPNGKYLGDEKTWGIAQNSIQKMADKFAMNYKVGIDEAAMYGPKMDFMATDAMGRKHQLATVQLDYMMPERFGLKYIDSGSEEKTPIMIHCAFLGSIERFLSVYIEHTAGKFPIWCAPEQLRIIRVNDSPDVNNFANEVLALAKTSGVRAALDDSNNSVGKKIREAEIWKIPYSVVIGEREAVSRELTPRIRGDLVSETSENNIAKTYATEKLIEKIANEAKIRTNKSTL